MAILKVPNMQCKHCEASITKALTAANLDFTVNLENKTVTVNGCDKCLAKAVSALDAIGFQAIKED